MQAAEMVADELWFHPRMIACVKQALRSHEVVREFHGQRQRRHDVEPDLPQIVAGLAGEVFWSALEDRHLMVHPPDDVGKGAAQRRADELELRKLVEHA